MSLFLISGGNDKFCVFRYNPLAQRGCRVLYIICIRKTGLIPNIPPYTVMGVALSVKVEDAEVYGSVEGTLESTSKICVRSTGNVTGTVIYRTMVRFWYCVLVDEVGPLNDF